MTTDAKYLDNLKPSPDDSRDYQYKAAAIVLPPHVDLLPDVNEIENQYQTGSCTANAAASALEIAYKRAGHVKDFSRLFIYWFTRKLSGITDDSGAFPRDIGKALVQNGVCLEPTWDFNLTKVNVEPSDDAKAEAKQYPVLEYARLQDSDIVTQIKTAVASGIPVLTTLKVTSYFNGLGPNWKTHDWNPERDITGSHEVIIIGYDDAAQRFLAQNSWSSTWGDGGFFGIPYNRIGLDYSETTKSCYEYWILSKLPVPYFDADGKETQIIVTPKEDLETNPLFKLAVFAFFCGIFYILFIQK